MYNNSTYPTIFTINSKPGNETKLHWKKHTYPLNPNEERKNIVFLPSFQVAVSSAFITPIIIIYFIFAYSYFNVNHFKKQNRKQT